MQRSTDYFLTSHVGSLPREKDLMHMMWAREDGVPVDGNAIGGIGRVNAIAFHPTVPNRLYAGAPAGGLWRSDDNGGTWSTNTDLLPNLGVSAIAIDPLHLFLLPQVHRCVPRYRPELVQC